MERKATILRLRQFCERHPEFTPDALRWQIHNAQHNGLAKSGAVLRVKSSPNARRGAIYIDADAYFDWLRTCGRTG